MKLKNVIPKRNHPEFIWRFGGAKLVKLQSGQHELIGGSEQDKADALDWISLFAPEIVFHHFHRACRCRQADVEGCSGQGRQDIQRRGWRFFNLGLA